MGCMGSKGAHRTLEDGYTVKDGSIGEGNYAAVYKAVDKKKDSGSGRKVDRKIGKKVGSKEWKERKKSG